MKRAIVVFLAVVFMAGVAWAGDDEELCTAVSNLANTIMEKRQANVSMSKMMGILSPIKDENLKSVVRKIIIKAYDTPAFQVPENQARAVVEFENEVFLQCIKARR